MAAGAGADADIDVLSDVLRAVRLTGALFFPLETSSPWCDAVPRAALFTPVLLPGAQHVVSYHVITHGTCWASLAGETPILAGEGDVIVIPHGDAYVLSSAPGLASDLSPEAVIGFFQQLAGAAPAVVVEGGGGPDRAALVCGFLGCDVRPFNPVLGALPRLLHVRRTTAGDDRLAQLVAIALAEARQPRSGSRGVVLRLSELLFIEVIRRHLDALPADQTGWLSGLRDPMVGRALARLHGRPAHPWTLDGLARSIGVSRSALADRFTRVVGEPPMRYLARWRIQLAIRLLADEGASVSAAALDVGYRSEAAFSRAFKKTVGAPPAAWRRVRTRPA